MAGYRLLIKPSASRELARVGQKSDRVRLVERIRALASDPRPRGCERLPGEDDLCRTRLGAYRVIYAIDDAAREVHVVKVGHRRDVYR